MGYFNINNIDPFLCTHLIYAFGTFTDNYTLTESDKHQDLDNFGYKNFSELKEQNYRLKTLLAIGGWNEGSKRFSQMAANPQYRQIFIKNTIKYLRDNRFDGLNIDWQYPAARIGSNPADKENYAQFLQEFREELKKESETNERQSLLLVIGIPSNMKFIEGFDIPKLNKYVDWMNIISYDYHDPHETIIDHHSPLYTSETDSDNLKNVDATVKYYLKAGAEPKKLVVGIPTYGRSYTLLNSDNHEIGAPANGPGLEGEFTKEGGLLAYFEICKYVMSYGWQVVQPNPNISGPYAYKDDQWVGYDDMMIIRHKAEYVNAMGLGGIMFWTIDQDDYSGTCLGIKYPLIKAGSEALKDNKNKVRIIQKSAFEPGE